MVKGKSFKSPAPPLLSTPVITHSEYCKQYERAEQCNQATIEVATDRDSFCSATLLHKHLQVEDPNQYINTSLAEKGALAHCLQRRTTCKIQNGGGGLFFGLSKQLSLNKFFDPSTPSMRKGRDGGKKNGKKNGGEKKKKIRMKIVATTSLPAVDRPNADRWNAARSRQQACLAIHMWHCSAKLQNLTVVIQILLIDEHSKPDHLLT